MAREKKSKIFTAFSALCLTAIVIMGCPSQPSWIDKIGSDMDKIAKGYEKFGTVSMSSPILVEAKREPNNGGFFDFNLPASPNEYYTDARTNIQGQSAIFDQFVKTSGLGLTVQINLIGLRRSAADINDYNIPDISNVAPEVNQVLGVLSDSNFTKFLGLLEGSPEPTVSNRSAITTAAGDTVTEGIFRLLGNPAEAMQFEDKIIMFGVSMVTVNPGWLTNKNYTAELAVSCDYSYEPARRELLIKLLAKEEGKKNKTGYEKDEKLIELVKNVLNKTAIDENNIKIKYVEGKKSYETKDDFVPQRFKKEFREDYAPLSAAVSPMTDVDTLDLASSQRLQVSEALRMAAALSYAGGAKGQAEYLEEWAKRREQDVRTRSAYAAVTAFSNGGFFGFRIRPRLKALENPALFGSKPGNVLEQQAFPVVVIVGIDRDDLQLGFDIKRDPNGEPEKDKDGKLRLVAYEPMISFWQTTNWLPNNNSRERLSETERLRWACSYMKANETLDAFAEEDEEEEDIKPTTSKNNKENKAHQTKGKTSMSDEENTEDEENTVKENVENLIRKRISLLGYHTLDSWNEQYIPIDIMVNKE